MTAAAASKFDSRGSRLCLLGQWQQQQQEQVQPMANGCCCCCCKVVEGGGGGSWGILQPHRRRAAAAAAAAACQPVLESARNSHCPSTQQLPFACGKWRMCWVAAASGPAWQSYWLLPLLPLPLAKKAKPAAGQAGKQKLFAAAAVIGRHWPRRQSRPRHLLAGYSPWRMPLRLLCIRQWRSGK
jgi:hypothetical protein